MKRYFIGPIELPLIEQDGFVSIKDSAHGASIFRGLGLLKSPQISSLALEMIFDIGVQYSPTVDLMMGYVMSPLASLPDRFETYWRSFNWAQGLHTLKDCYRSVILAGLHGELGADIYQACLDRTDLTFSEGLIFAAATVDNVDIRDAVLDKIARAEPREAQAVGFVYAARFLMKWWDYRQYCPQVEFEEAIAERSPNQNHCTRMMDLLRNQKLDLIFD